MRGSRCALASTSFWDEGASARRRSGAGEGFMAYSGISRGTVVGRFVLLEGAARVARALFGFCRIATCSGRPHAFAVFPHFLCWLKESAWRKKEPFRTTLCLRGAPELARHDCAVLEQSGALAAFLRMAALSPCLRATRRTRRHFQWRLGQAARVSAACPQLWTSNPLGPLWKRGWCMARLAALARHALCACTMQLRRLVFRASQRVARDARRASSWQNAFCVRHVAFPAALLAQPLASLARAIARVSGG